MILLSLNIFESFDISHFRPYYISKQRQTKTILIWEVVDNAE